MRMSQRLSYQALCRTCCLEVKISCLQKDYFSDCDAGSSAWIGRESSF